MFDAMVLQVGARAGLQEQEAELLLIKDPSGLIIPGGIRARALWLNVRV